MSLLDRINERNGQKQQTIQTGQEAMAKEEAQPDAGQTNAQARRDYGGSIAAGPDQDLQDEAASPEEQDMFTQMEKELAEVVYGQQASGSIVESVMAAGDPVEGIGRMANDITGQLAQKYPNAEGDVLLAIGETAVEQVVDLVESANPNVSLTDDQMAEALSIAVSAYMEKNPNAVDDDMQQYMNEQPPAQL